MKKLEPLAREPCTPPNLKSRKVRLPQPTMNAKTSHPNPTKHQQTITIKQLTPHDLTNKRSSSARPPAISTYLYSEHPILIHYPARPRYGIHTMPPKRIKIPLSAWDDDWESIADTSRDGSSPAPTYQQPQNNYSNIYSDRGYAQPSSGVSLERNRAIWEQA